MADEAPKQGTPSGNPGSPSQYTGYAPYPYQAPGNDEIDLREIWSVIWRGKWLIVAITTVFAVASVLYALFLPNIYQSKTLLAPSDDSRGGGMSRMAGQLGGLASLAGINMSGSGGEDKIAVAMAVLQSRQFISNFIERHELLPELLAVKSWDRNRNELFFDTDVYDANKNEWVREVTPPRAKTPSAWEAYKAFSKILSVTKEQATGFVTIAVEHQSPVIARRWVTLLVEDVNQEMRAKDVAEAKRSIDFLQNQLAAVALADMRTVFYQLIEEQTKTIMLAAARDEYVFRTIDPPVVAEERAKPKRALICVLGVLLGGMLSVLIVIIRYFFRDTGKPNPADPSAVHTGKSEPPPLA